LKFIRIPQSIRWLQKDWYGTSSLLSVTFESGASLLRMIEDGTVDLKDAFGITIGQWDAAKSFPGYSISIVPGVDNLVQLVKKGSK
jgi:hypothetical protein